MPIDSMRDVLNPQFLSKAYEKVASATISNPLMETYGSRPLDFTGDKIEQPIFDDARSPLPLNTPGSVARTVSMLGATKVYHSPYYMFNEATIPMQAVQYLRQFDNPGVQNKGLQELQRQFRLFGRRHATTKALILAKTLSDGVVYYDPTTGDVRETSSGALTIDLGVPASHKAQLAHASNGGSDIIGTAWDQSGAKIIQDLDQIREAAEYDKAPPPKHVWLHPVAKQWLRDNTEFSKFIPYADVSRIDAMLRSFATGADRKVSHDSFDIGDYTFHFWAGTYDDANGVTRPFIPKTKAIITPEPTDSDWLMHLNSDEMIPTSEGVFGSLEEAINGFTTVFGDFAYFQLKGNANAVSMLLGWKGWFGFADVNAPWMPTVDF